MYWDTWRDYLVDKAMEEMEMATTIKELEMTEEQAVSELEFMRGFEKYLIEQLGAEKYIRLCTGYAAEKTAKELRDAGMSEDDTRAVCKDVVRRMVGINETN